MLLVGIVLLVLAGIAQLAAHLTFVAVVLFVLAAGVLILRWALLGPIATQHLTIVSEGELPAPL